MIELKERELLVEERELKFSKKEFELQNWRKISNLIHNIKFGDKNQPVFLVCEEWLNDSKN
ncbi:hypothetical protein RhiirA5_417336 [Rhizophagus irregularis]|uniref:Uncharacterized protein n=1 Tax=Rhizophagus irregularis TaxID=588596 RepID=A0A2N0PMM5_9GLOM|nr:hypothetical protein RhiirA5_417336 [Rhizophagus irregularis]GET57767.1 hypothetical protein RIR_e9573_A0A2N0PMM5_9GLOM [Rhizophagus irregularis DAOM 181602=DAOM 197198]